MVEAEEWAVSSEVVLVAVGVVGAVAGNEGSDEKDYKAKHSVVMDYTEKLAESNTGHLMVAEGGQVSVYTAEAEVVVS